METIQPLKHTAIFDRHVALGARMVPFGGWEMPIQYSSILAEARAVRSNIGLFDVSHMGQLAISGSGAGELLESLLTAKVLDLRAGRARYSMMCDDDGGIMDDVVIYRLQEEDFLLVCNAGNRPKVVPWIKRWIEDQYPGVQMDDRTEQTVMLALQGPNARIKVFPLLGSNEARVQLARPFRAVEEHIGHHKALISSTGYTGEEGVEIIADREDGASLWDELLGLGAEPCGLGARDVLRLEAGLALHGNDIDSTTTPLEAALDRYVNLDKDFVGASALRSQSQSRINRRLVGLKMEGRSIARPGYPIMQAGKTIGKVTSGTFSPTLGAGIAMGYVEVQHAVPGELVEVDIRGTTSTGHVVQLPFYARRRTQ